MGALMRSGCLKGRTAEEPFAADDFSSGRSILREPVGALETVDSHVPAKQMKR